MNDTNLNMPANATHLGIKRDTSSKFGVKLVVPDRIQTARKTVYALMWAGLYGMNGINPMVSIHMIKCFVLPRLLYGLDVIRLTKTDIKNLSTYFVQHLPVRTSTAAVLILAGQIQIEAELLKLSLFRNIAENKGSMENNIAFRKLAIKPEDSNSWFIQIVKVTEMYNLPSPRDILNPVPK